LANAFKQKNGSAKPNSGWLSQIIYFNAPVVPGAPVPPLSAASRKTPLHYALLSDTPVVLYVLASDLLIVSERLNIDVYDFCNFSD